jgi:trimethylamine--corrinoid protein Co-methyltransferase
MVLENEIAGYIGQYLKGIVVDDERLAVDEILKVGPLPGSYMAERHTRRWYREEFFIPELSNREFFESWERGHTELQEKAKQKAAKILENQESPVASEIQSEIDDFLDFVVARDTD